MRSKEFDPKEAASLALEKFWEDGYSETSMSSLLQAMNITRGSFYSTFGSKKKIFITALASYLTLIDQFVSTTLEQSEDHRVAVRGLLEGFLSITRTKQRWKGCLIGNTTREAIGRDTEVASLLEDGFSRLCRAFEEALSLNPPHALTASQRRFKAVNLASALQGMLIAARCRVPEEVLQKMVDSELERIE